MRIVLSLIACLSLFSCSPEVKKETQFLEISDFDNYQSPANTPAPIQIASKAVIRIRNLDGSMGTGFMISKDGRMMTNNHIIGRANCPASGCYFDIDLYYQNDISYDKSKNTKRVFGRPIYTSETFDFTVVQLHETNPEGEQIAEKMHVEHVVSFEKKTAKDLLDTKIYIIGHPLGGMKKVKETRGYEIDSKFIRMTDYVFGGNSGSPIVNDQGKVVGILHSGQDGVEALSKNGIHGHSNATPSAEIFRLMGEEAQELKTAEVHSQNVQSNFTNIDSSSFVDLGLILAAQRVPVKVAETGGVQQALDDQFANCEMMFSKMPESLYHFDGSVFGCFPNLYYVNCSGESKEKDLFPCPQGERKNKWMSFVTRVFDHAVYEFNSLEMSIFPLIVAGRLQNDIQTANNTKKQMISGFLKTEPVMNFGLAEILSKHDIDYVDPKTGLNADQFVTQFRENPYHYKALYTIAQYHILKYDMEPDTEKKTSLVDVFRYVMSHRDLTIGDRFLLETVAYERDLLKLL